MQNENQPASFSQGDQNHAPVRPIGATIRIQIEYSLVCKSHGFALSAEDLARIPPAGIGYLIARGFDRDIGSHAARNRAKRFAEILEGTATSARDRATQRRVQSLERQMRNIATERVIQFCIRTGRRRPKAAELARTVDAMLADPNQLASLRADAGDVLAAAASAPEPPLAPGAPASVAGDGAASEAPRE